MLPGPRLFALFLLLTPLVAQSRHVLVIGIDGFRHDYAQKFAARNIAGLRERGAGERLQPWFPSSTFPNFYSMVTGLRPDDHGIVAMTFFDRTLRTLFSYKTSADFGRFYGGTPIWNRVAAGVYSWPGSGAEIGGKRPWRWFAYDPKTTHEEKVKTVLQWFALPEAERPRLAMVYFADVDQAGHAYGPDSEEVKAAVAKVDASVGALLDGIAKLPFPVDVVAVSDHGMSAVTKTIDLSAHADFKGVTAANDLSMTMLYHPDSRRVNEVYKQLKKGAKDYHVYRRLELPGNWRYGVNLRVGDLVVVPKGTYVVYVRPDEQTPPVPQLKGMHGYDPDKYDEMDGICYAAGPQIKPGEKLELERSSGVYGLIVQLLGLSSQPRR